jgi:hypothetical protein
MKKTQNKGPKLSSSGVLRLLDLESSALSHFRHAGVVIESHN